MKHGLIIGVALAALSLPAFAQGTTSTSNPARVGYPGQIGGGVPGSKPNVMEQRMIERKAATPAPEAPKVAKKRRKKVT